MMTILLYLIVMALVGAMIFLAAMPLAALHKRSGQEAELRQASKMESVGRLAGGIAHDFNNLLVGILGNASWLARGKEEGTREWEATQRIVAAGRRAADLTRQMLAYSGRARLETALVNVHDVVRTRSGRIGRRP